MIAALPLVTSSVTSALSSLLGAKPSVAPPAGAGESFSSVLASVSQDAVTKMKASEAASIAGIQGKATTQSVVEAVMAAQEALQTALAVRDKAVAAFQDVTRMPI